MDVCRIIGVTQVRVIYAYTDKMGVVYNGRYFEFFETGRAELMRKYGMAYTEFEKAGYLLPLVETGAKYISSAYYDDLLDVQAEMIFENKPTLKFEYNIFRGNTTIAKGFTVHSFLKAATMTPVKPPKIFTDALEQFNKTGRFK